MSKKGRGSVGRSLRQGYRLKHDKEFREKQKKLGKDWWNKNREKCNEKRRKQALELSKFKNKRCSDCNKLLNWRTKGNYCRKCRSYRFGQEYRKKIKKIKN